MSVSLPVQDLLVVEVEEDRHHAHRRQKPNVIPELALLHPFLEQVPRFGIGSKMAAVVFVLNHLLLTVSRVYCVAQDHYLVIRSAPRERQTGLKKITPSSVYELGVI